MQTCITSGVLQDRLDHPTCPQGRMVPRAQPPHGDPAPLLLLNLRISVLPLGEHQEPLTMAGSTPRQWVSFPEGFYSIISLHNFLPV